MSTSQAVVKAQKKMLQAVAKAELPVYLASVQDLLILKRHAAREKDISDIAVSLGKIILR